jgi:hypothetical protein
MCRETRKSVAKMPTQTRIKQESDDIKEVLRRFPEGASIDEIETNITLDLTRKTLQRRLLRLKESDQIKVTGKGRATRYLLTESGPADSVLPVDVSIVSLSTAGKEIQRLLNRPLQSRTPVGYNRSFLESYRPNITAYLSPSEHKKLAEIGKTSVSERPAGTYAKEILSRLLIDLSWNSSRLEGNTYSLLDTQRLIAFGEAAEGKSALDAQMILNHKDAIEFLVQSAEEIGFNRYTVLNLHALLANNLLPDPQAAGRLRYMSVAITGSVYEPLAVPQLISECFDLLLAKAAAISNPFEQAFFVMVQQPYLQPFDDVNKRVSRLAANIPLLAHNLAPLSFVDVPEQIYARGILGVYELNRIELLRDVFLWAYERSAARYAAIRQSLGEPDPFRLRYRDAIRNLVAEIVTAGMDQKAAADAIAVKALALPKADQARFIEMVETELLALHEGNFARYRIRPSTFAAWQQAWGSLR